MLIRSDWQWTYGFPEKYPFPINRREWVEYNNIYQKITVIKLFSAIRTYLNSSILLFTKGTSHSKQIKFACFQLSTKKITIDLLNKYSVIIKSNKFKLSFEIKRFFETDINYLELHYIVLPELKELTIVYLPLIRTILQIIFNSVIERYNSFNINII